MGVFRVKKIILICAVVLVLFLIAFSGKMKDEKKILAERKYHAAPAAGEMVKIAVNGREFLIDVYEYPNKKGEIPKGGMTYDAARRACESAGKRLCTNSEWTEACQGARLAEYGFGKVFIKKKCNNLHSDRRVASSGGFSGCATKDGVYDMSGNLWEWVSPGKTGALQAKGGSFRDGELSERCVFTFKLFRVQEKGMSFDNFGARCCKEP